MAYVLEAEELTKHYGRVKALTNFSIKVASGTIWGILGPNGSGKTTCLSILLDVQKQDSGSFRWFDRSASHHTRKRRIGALLESPNYYPYLSGVQNLRVVAAIKNKGRNNIHTALTLTDLAHRRNAKFSTYSLGMKQRLAIAGALLGSPEALVLDEPTNGLDPQGIKEVREIILEVNRAGRTVILASHMLDEVEKVCTHVAILKSGELLASGKVSDVLAKDNQLEVAADNLELLEKLTKEIKGLASYEKNKDRLLLKFSQTVNPGDINRYYFDKGLSLTLLNEKRKSLENLFLEITKSNA